MNFYYLPRPSTSDTGGNVQYYFLCLDFFKYKEERNSVADLYPLPSEPILRCTLDLPK